MSLTFLLYVFAFIIGISKSLTTLSLWSLSFIPLAFFFLFSFKRISALLFSSCAFVCFFFLILFESPDIDLSQHLAYSLAITCFLVSFYFPFPLISLDRLILPFIITSIPGLLFLYSPPPIYSSSLSNDGFISNVGFFGTYALTGFLPSSWYLATLCSVFILYVVFVKHPSFKSFFNSRVSVASVSIALLCLLATNRKFLFVIAVAPIIFSFLSSRQFLSSLLGLRFRSLFFLSIFFVSAFAYIALLTTGLDSMSLPLLYESVIDRYHFTVSLISLGASSLYLETGIQLLLFFFGIFGFLALTLLLLIPFLLRLCRDRPRLFVLLVPTLFILDFYFKAAPLLFSPSPSSLAIFCLISYSFFPNSSAVDS